MSCPVDLPPAEIETWFINLWNHFLIPYLMGTIMAGIEVCGGEGEEEEGGGGGMTETFVRRDVLYARCCHRGGWYSDGRLT